MNILLVNLPKSLKPQQLLGIISIIEGYVVSY